MTQWEIVRLIEKNNNISIVVMDSKAKRSV
ncbi:hypothetical protein IGK70_002030 [Enterococcus sp. DIV0358]